MAVFRIEKTRDYTVMSNHHLRDKSLSLKAKGLLSLMLSLPEEWDYTTKGLARICKDGVDSICAGVRELEEHGYVIRQRVRNPNGQLGAIEYTILEQPRPPKPGKPKRENPVLDNPEQAYPVLEEPEQGNPAQLNTNRSSKEKSKKDLSSTEGSNPVLSSPQVPRGSDGMGRNWMRERESYRELILENIEYDYLIQNRQLDRDRLDELVELMVDTVCSRRETIRIAGDDYPAEVVKSRFLKLDSSHIEYVLDRMRENTTYVRNIKKYLLAALYNAPATIGSYYTCCRYYALGISSPHARLLSNCCRTIRNLWHSSCCRSGSYCPVSSKELLMIIGRHFSNIVSTASGSRALARSTKSSNVICLPSFAAMHGGSCGWPQCGASGLCQAIRCAPLDFLHI